MLENILLEENIARILMPENLAIGLMVAKQHQKCSSIGCDFDYFGFAFGQSPFHVPPTLDPGPGKGRFDKENPWRTICLIIYALIAFRLKVDPVKIKEKYYGKK